MRKLKLFFACLLMAVLSIGQVWADKITAVANIESGKTYYIGATKSNSTDYYLSIADHGVAAASGKAGSAVTSKSDADVFTFTQSGDNWTIQFASGKYLSLKNAKANGKVDVVDAAAGWTISDENSLLLLAINNYCLKCNSQTNTANFGSYASGQLNVWLEEASATPAVLLSIAVSGTPTTKSYEAGAAFDPAGLVVTGTYDVGDPATITSSITWTACKTEGGTYVALNDEAVALAKDETGIYVKATVSEITSPAFHVTGLTVTAAQPKITIDGSATGITSTDETQSITAGVGSFGGIFKQYSTTALWFTKGSGYIYNTASFGYIRKITINYKSGGAGDAYQWIKMGSSAMDSYEAASTNGVKYETSAGGSSNTFVVDGDYEYFCLSVSNKNLQASSIVIEYDNNASAPKAATPTFPTGDENFVTSTSVTLACTTEGAKIYYTTNGDVPTSSSTLYNGAIPVSATTTIKAIAVADGMDNSNVAEKTFTKATVLTVAQALTAIDALADNGTIENQYVSGVISQIDGYNSTYHSITYWISADGTTTNQLEVYSGKGLNGADFSAVSDLNVGDDVTVSGTLKKYVKNSVTTPEFIQNNVIVARKPIARLAWAGTTEGAYAASLEGGNTFPTLTNSDGVSVSYSSSETSYASFSDASDYSTLTLNAVGSTVITATFAGNSSFKANSASYTLNVSSSVIKADISFECNGATSCPETMLAQSNLPSPLPTITMAGKNFGGWWTTETFEEGTEAVAGAAVESTDAITLYAKWLDPYNIAAAKAVIDATPAGTANQYVAGKISQIDSYNNTYHSITYWISDDGTTTDQIQVYSGLIGNAATPLGKEQFSAVTDLELGDEVVVFGTLKLHNSTTYEFDKNNTIYSFNRPVVPVSSVELASTATVKVGNSINLSASVLPANATDKEIVWSIVSGDANITLDNGAVTGVEEGTAVVRATSHADNTKYAECTITIEAADPTYAYYFYGKVTETAGIEDGQYLIVYEDESVAFNGGLETLDAAHNTIAVEIEDGLIVSNATTDAASFTIGVTAGTIQAAMGDYIGVTSYSNGLKQNADATTYPAHSFSIDEEGNAIVSLNNGWSGTMILNYNTGSSDKRFRYYKDGSQKKIQLYKRFGTDVAPKANPHLAWDPAEDIEITVGDEFTAPTLTYVEGFDGVAAVAIESDNTDLAIVTAGVVSLLADATGEANITATFAGNDNYKAATASYKITVNASVVPPTPAVSGNVVIIAEYESKFYAMTNSLASGALAGVEVEKDGSKIVVSSAEDKAAIQWTATVTGENTTFQDGESKYLAHTGSGTNLMLADDAENWTFDSENGCYSAVSGRAFFFYNTSSVFKNYSISSNLGKPGYSGAPEVIEIDPDDIVITSKVDPALAYTPASDEITVGDDWSAPVLGYVEGFDGLAAITYESSNEAVATVTDAGVIALAGGTGTATITATFAGNASYLAGSATYTVKVNEPAEDCDGTDDFLDTEDKGNPTSYTDRSTPNGWSAVNAGYKVIEEKAYWMINGKTTAVGVITSPELTGGLGSLKFRYANTNSESNGVSVKIEIKQGGDVVKEYTLTKPNSEVVQNTVYTELIEDINVAGTFQIVITNLSPSNNTGNKDRVSIGRFCWSNYSAPEPVLDWTEVRDELEINRFYTVCLPKTITHIKGATFWTLANRNAAGTLAYLTEEVASELEPLPAGKPFIIRATAAKLEVVYNGDEVADPIANGALRGLLNSTMDQDAIDAAALAEGSDIYMLKNNELHKANGQTGNSMVEYRAYVVYEDLNVVDADPVPAPGRRVLKMPMQKDQAQGFESIEASEKPMKLMINGQMYILRGEKMYDATGRLVK